MKPSWRRALPALRLSLALLVSSSTVAAGATEGGGHRLPAPPTRERTAPEGGWDTARLEELQALSDYVARRTFRIEAFRAPEPPYDASNMRMEDGAGVVISEGRLLTTARYVAGADEVRVIRKDGRAVTARVERVDEEIGLAMVAFDPDEVPGTAVLAGYAPLPRPHAEGAASEVVVPMQLTGTATAVKIAALLQGDDALFLSGQLANGVPAFDTRGRLVALADRPTPDRTRSVALAMSETEAWLEKEERGVSADEESRSDIR